MTLAPYRSQVAALVAVLALGIAGIAYFRHREDDAGIRASQAARADTAHGDEQGEEAAAPVVTLSEASVATAQIQVQAVRVGSVGVAGAGLEVPAQVEFDPRRVAVVSPRSDGRIERLTVVEGDRVRAGQVLALVNSREYLVAQSDLQQAARRSAMLSGGPDAAGATALLAAARRRMTLLGASDAEIGRVASGGEPSLYLALTAPFAGSVVTAHLLPGQAVRSGDPVFTVADLSVVDVIAEVPERSLPMVRVGQGASVVLAAFPAQPFAGRVERLRDQLNPETRTVRAVIHVSNGSGRLRPGMFATVRLAASGDAAQPGAPGQAGSTLLMIPESAVVTDGDRRYVFVQAAPRTYERREVVITPVAPPGSSVVSSEFVLVRSGLRAGEQVVTRGAFTLKSELAKAGLGDDH